MTYGFFTVATGDEQYYKMAANLLRTYRHFSAEPVPFAILAERENEYTALFDCVRIMPHARRSYLDKLELYDLLPYDVNIFIDADCLAYGDLNRLFTLFESADDFSCFGRVLPLNDKTGWFEYDNLTPELKKSISYIVGLHGGIYYIRKTEKAKAVFDRAKEFSENYSDYGFKGKFATPGDEPLIALSMAANGLKPIPHDLRGILCYWEHLGQMKLSVADGTALAKDIKLKTDLLHWGTRYTRTPLYRKQIADLDCIERGGGIGLALNRVKYSLQSGFEGAKHFFFRCVNKLKRMTGIK